MSKQTRIPRRPVDGVLLFDKPRGLSSNTALQAARRLLNAAKAGHTGTLDPMATGLLPLTFGEATKFSQMLLDADKEYVATVRLGVETDTGDAEGRPLSEAPIAFSDAALFDAMERLRGEIEQIPPMHSALKRDGKPLYEYARAGLEVERPPRKVVIHTLELLKRGADFIEIRVACSKGTYIRTLAVDLGRLLGCGGHLTALRRTRIGPFSVTDAVTLEQLEECPVEQRDAFLAPVDRMVTHLPQVELSADAARSLMHGQPVQVDEGEQGLVRAYSAGRFLGLGEIAGGGKLSPRRLLATDPGLAAFSK